MKNQKLDKNNLLLVIRGFAANLKPLTQNSKLLNEKAHCPFISNGSFSNCPWHDGRVNIYDNIRDADIRHGEKDIKLHLMPVWAVEKFHIR